MKNTKVMAGVIYARYSSHAQRDVSIEQQLRACRQFAEREGIKIVGTYEDRALSGTSDRRPMFQQMIRDSEKHEWSYVIVYTLDRFARDRYDSAVYKRTLRNNGAKVLSASEFISDDPTGVLMESVLEGFAEYYSKELSRKVTRGMEDNARKCMVNGSLPLGYVKGPDNKYAVDEAEAQIVQECYRRVAAGERFTDLINDLNGRGVRTKQGRPWNRSSFTKMLSNERYIGVYQFGQIRIPGGVPTIIDGTLFDTVQQVLRTKKNPRQSGLPTRRRRDNSIYLLTGKLFCGKCKSPMIGICGTGRSGDLHHYYICKGKRQDHNGCTKKPVRRDRIELAIAKSLQEAMMTDETISALADAAIAYQEQNDHRLELDALKARSAENKASIRNIIKAIESGIFSDATQSRLHELESEEKELAGQLALAQYSYDNKLTREQIIAALKIHANGNVQDQEYRELLIDAFLVSAYVYDDRVRITFNLGLGKTADSDIPIDIDSIPFNESILVRIDACSVHQIRPIILIR